MAEGNNGQYETGGEAGRAEERSRIEEQQYQPQPIPHQSPSYSLPPHPKSPATSASPFAFAPPPLTAHSTGHDQSATRPPLPFHHSEPLPHHAQYPNFAQKPPLVPHHHSFPSYPGSVPMGHRSFSSDTSRQSPSQSYMPRPGGPSISSPGLPPVGSDSPYGYPRHPSYSGSGPSISHSPHQQSPQRSSMYPPSYYGNLYNQAPPPSGGSEVPRSLSYSSVNYQHPHPYQPTYQPHPMSHPPLLGAAYQSQSGPPPLHRIDTMGAISHGLSEVEISKPAQPGLGYSFACRLPLVDRPYKCDECVQSFNRNHDLKRHKRIHLSVKPFGCDKCGKTFSRKDALRRHWLVKGCRGDDGATAPIIPLFPINSTPELSPPSPTQDSPSNSGLLPSSTLGFNHPAAPPPLHTLPHRQSSHHSQILVTPEDPIQSTDRRLSVNPPMDEPRSIGQHSSAAHSGDNGGSAADGYFEGVVGLKSDGTAQLENAQGGSSYSSSPSLAQPQFHYQSPSTHESPMIHQGKSPTSSLYPPSRTYTPTVFGNEEKPTFALPFARTEYVQAPAFEHNGVQMEKQGSQMSQASVEGDYQTVAPRWHRPSFPFPPTQNVYIYDPDQASHPSASHGYGQ